VNVEGHEFQFLFTFVKREQRYRVHPIAYPIFSKFPHRFGDAIAVDHAALSLLEGSEKYIWIRREDAPETPAKAEILANKWAHLVIKYYKTGERFYFPRDQGH
jgi:hypothetical protein